MERLSLEEYVGHHAEDDEREYFLDDLQLHEGEWSSIAFETNAIGRHLTAVLKEGDGPGESDDANEGPVVADTRLLQFEVTIPRQGHEYVAAYQQDYCI